MVVMLVSRLRLSVVLGTAFVLTAGVTSTTGCSSSERRDGDQVGGGSTSGSGSSSGVGGINLNTGGNVNVGANGGGLNPDDFCQSAQLNFVPQTPTVLVLVDRSSSMFDTQADQTQFWPTLKNAVLPVIEGLQADIRFGFASYTGSTGTCEGLSAPTPFAVNNYAAIEGAYNALSAPSQKGETPTAKAIEQAAALLLADTAPGDRYILLVTDGDPDFCDDPPAECGADALVASLQLAAAQGVRTLVFGLENAGIRYPERFDYYAQAGMGQQPNWSDGTQAVTAGQYSGTLEGACKSTGGGEWARYRTANGNNPPATGCPHDYMAQPPYFCFLPAGKYSTEGGTAQAFLSTDTAALAAQITSTVSGLKSCTFDMTGSLKVEAGMESTGKVFIQDQQIAADLWSMENGTVITLLGAACDQWQSPDATKFDAGFPCEALIVK